MKKLKKIKWIDEFKEFISRGSVVDLAVGIIVGSAFTAIVTSFVNDILMPIIGLILGKINFTSLRFVIVKATETSAEVAINYGNFLQKTVDFLLTALAVFVMIKFINQMHRMTEKKKEAMKEEPKKEEVKVPEDILLLQEIRDLLKQKNTSKVQPLKNNKKV